MTLLITRTTASQHIQTVTSVLMVSRNIDTKFLDKNPFKPAKAIVNLTAMSEV